MGSRDRKRPASAWSAVVVALALLALAAMPAEADPVDRAVTTGGLLEHLEALQAIADANGGTRDAGTAGYDASVAYVVGVLEASGFAVTTEAVILEVPTQVGPSSFERTAPSSRTYVEGVDYDEPSPQPPSTPTGDVHLLADACDDGQVAAIPAGAVVLTTITADCSPYFATAVVATLSDAGALLFVTDLGPGAPPKQIDVGEMATLNDLAVLSLSGDAGAELTTLAGGATVTVSIDTGWATSLVPTSNVIGERPGLTDEVVLVGAHLDSVPEGPGINDDGSGVAGLLEIAQALGASDTSTRRTVRLGFWAAEEIGLIGSSAYVASLSQAERDRIVAYLNNDMIGSPNGGRFVYDPAVAELPETVSPGSAAITERFLTYFSARGLATAPAWSNGRSDDAAFAEAGIPVGGLFSGAEEIKTPAQAALWGGTAGVAFDPCYHLACDDLSNVDVDLAAEMASALLWVTLELAEEVEAPPTPTTTTTPAGPAMAVAAVPALTG